MQFNFNFQFSKKTKPLEMMGKVWGKVHTLVFFIVLLLTAVAGWYFWQKSLFGQGWNEQRKQEYLNSQNKDVIFNEKGFQKVIGDVQARRNYDPNSYAQIKDIFAQYR